MLKHFHKNPALILIMALSLVFSGCGQAPGNTALPKNTETANTANNNNEPDKAAVCSGMCADIQKICAEDIAEGNTQFRDLESGILDETACLIMCETDWDDTTFNCISAADHCSQFSDQAPYCIETEDDGTDTPSTQTPSDCQTACKNYAKCTGYGDDISPQDQEDAYNTCLQVCATWPDKTRACVAQTAINQATDCLAQTACIIPMARQ